MESTKRLEKLNAGDSFDFRINDNPVCPHCGFVCDIHDLEWWELFEEGDHSVDCPECDLEFLVVSEAKWSFSTDQQDED